MRTYIKLLDIHGKHSGHAVLITGKANQETSALLGPMKMWSYVSTLELSGQRVSTQFWLFGAFLV